MAFSTQQRLMSLGVATPLAKELGTQFDTGSYNVFRLIEMGMDAGLAKIVVTQPFDRVKAAQLGMVPAVALLLSGFATNAFSPARSILAIGATDLNAVVCGDSTGNGTTHFIYLWFAALAALYPAYTFVYYPSDGAGGYASPITVTTGTGSRSFRLYNNSVNGSGPDFFMGSNFNAAFVTPGRTWDFVLWNHGKNISASWTQPAVQGDLMAAIAQFQLAFPTTQHIAIDQYPNRDDTTMAPCHAAWLDIKANAPGISIVDLYTLNYVFSDYQDNVHLTAAADAAKLVPAMVAFWNGTKAGSWTPEAPWLSSPTVNYLEFDTNPDCADFSLNGTSGSVPGAADAVPYRWTNSGTNTYSKEVSITYGGAARSQKIQGSGAALAFMFKGQTAAAIAALKGNNVVLTVIEYVAAGAAQTVGLIGLSPNGTGAVQRTARPNLGKGAWRVRCIGPVACPSDMTTLNALLYHDTAAAPDATHPVYYQWANLSIGNLPRSPA